MTDLKAVVRWLEASEWRMITTVLLGCAALVALVVWLGIRSHEKQCREKGTYTVCTRERFSHMIKIGDTYHAHYVCEEYAERPCEE